MNNPTEKLAFTEDVKYAIYQLEKAPTTGTLHYQIYIIMLKPCRLAHMIKTWPGVHWASARGNHKQVKEYCSKTASRVDGPWEYGSDERAGQGNGGNKFEGMKEVMDNGGTFMDVAEVNFGAAMRYPAGIEKYIQGKMKPRELAQKPLVRETQLGQLETNREPVRVHFPVHSSTAKYA